MKKPVYITTIKLHCDWEDDILVTTRPFTKEEIVRIKQNIEFYKNKHQDWEGSPCDLLDYAVLTPFKSIMRTIEQANIQVLA